MSVAAHREALRTALSGYFRDVTTGVTDATRTRQIADELKEASESLLAELVSEWQFTNAGIYCIPDDVLALCFTLLPFADRIFASHVSRRWRYISLTYPAVWSHIELETSLAHRPALFKMALDRTGSHPVDVLRCPVFDDDGIVEDSLAAHIHHIRSLSYTAMPRPGFLLLHAPLLERLRGGGDSEDLRITHEFLGGEVGRLTSLQAQRVVFPATCPALSTLINLAIQVPATTQDAAHFGQLFQLCPMLESLVLLEMTSEIAPFLPTGPVPASLSHILLESDEEDYDISVYCATWRLQGLRDLAIYQNAEAGEHLVHFFSGAFSVTVHRKRDSGTTGVVALGPGESRREIKYWEDDDDLGIPAAIMLEAQSTLIGVRTMSIPATSLPDYFSVLAVLPALQYLELKVQEIDNAPGKHIFLWDVLEPIARLPEQRPGLQSLILDVACGKPQCPPTTQDAEDLVAHLHCHTQVKLPPIFVTGFTTGALRGFEVPDFEEFFVAFVAGD